MIEDNSLSLARRERGLGGEGMLAAVDAMNHYI